MRQRRWLELVKDYDCGILYHPGKASRVAETLSRRTMAQLVSHWEISKPLQEEISRLNLEDIIGRLSSLTM